MERRLHALPSRTILVDLALEGGTLTRTHRLMDGGVFAQSAEPLSMLGAKLTDGDGVRGLAALHAILHRDDPNEIAGLMAGRRLGEAGRLLFEILFGTRWSEHTQPTLDMLYGEKGRLPTWASVRVRVHTREPLLMSLPWLATAANAGVPLVDHGWTFEVCVERDTPHLGYTSPGTVLIIAPALHEDEASGLGTARHIEAVEALLNGVVEDFTRSPHRYGVATTLDEVVRIAEKIRPELVYYYGRAGVVDSEAHLAIPSAHGTSLLLRDVWWHASTLRQHPPKAVLLNAGSVGFGGFQSAGFQLAPRVPLVIAHATKVMSGMAKSFALQWLGLWLKEGVDPIVAAHQRVRMLSQEPGDVATSDSFLHWATPSVFAHYGSMTTTLPRHKPIFDLEDPALWFDRIRQRVAAAEQVKHVVRHRSQRVEAMIAHGPPGNATEHLSAQIRDFVFREEGDKLHITNVIKTALPIIAGALTHEHFEAKLLDLRTADGQGPFSSLDGVLFALSPPPRGRSRVVWIDWGVVRGQHTPLIRAWLQFVRDRVTPAVERAFPVADRDDVSSKLVIIATITLETGAVEPALSKLLEDTRFRTPSFRCSALDEIKNPTRKELIDYLEEHGCPENIIDDLADAMMKVTGGRYEAILVLLRRGHKIGWPGLNDELEDTNGAQAT